MKRRIISVFLGVLMTFCLAPFSSAAAGDGTITVDTVTAARGDMVAVNLVYTGNPGIAAVATTVTYDADMLTYVKYTRGIVFGNEFPTIGDHPELNCLRVVYSNLGNSKSDGSMVTLFFKVKEEAVIGTTYEITIDYLDGDFCDWGPIARSPQIVAGGVSVICNHQYILISQKDATPGESGYKEYKCSTCDDITQEVLEYKDGDVNGDGTVDIRDLIVLKKMVAWQAPINDDADLNNDGKVNALDVILLRKRLLGL